MKLLDEKNLLQGQYIFNVPQGKYSQLWLAFEGVSDTGQALTHANLANVIMTYMNRQILHASVADLMFYANLWGGQALSNLATAGATQVFCPIPIGLPGSQNCINVQNAETLVIKSDGIVTSDVATAMVSCTVRLYGVENPFGIQTHFLRWMKETKTSISNIGHVYPTHENIAMLLLENDTYLEKLTVIQDGIEKYRADTKHALLAYTNFNYLLETYSASLSYVAVQLAQSGDLDSAQNEKTKLEIGCTSGQTPDVNIIYLCVDYVNSELDLSAESRDAALNHAINLKRSSGKPRSADLVERMYKPREVSA